MVTCCLRQMRFYQFSKNLLVFVPIISGHFYQLSLIGQFMLGFLAFCGVAASGYILNDIHDLPTDRTHTKKRLRPLANNEINLSTAWIMFAILLISTTILSVLYLPFYFQLVLITYFALTILYSFYLKKIVLVDVFALALFYSLRIFAGMTLVPQNGFSYWLITFSFFFFLSLAYIKRYSELLDITRHDQTAILGRGYLATDLNQIGLFGTVSAFAAIIVLMLYLNASSTMSLYSTPQLLWLTCLIILFWLLRIWTLVTRGHRIEDPIAFALTDKLSLILLILTSSIYVLATVI